MKVGASIQAIWTPFFGNPAVHQPYPSTQPFRLSTPVRLSRPGWPGGCAGAVWPARHGRFLPRCWTVSFHLFHPSTQGHNGTGNEDGPAGQLPCPSEKPPSPEGSGLGSRNEFSFGEPCGKSPLGGRDGLP